jgi:hypothetical protein
MALLLLDCGLVNLGRQNPVHEPIGRCDIKSQSPTTLCESSGGVINIFMFIEYSVYKEFLNDESQIKGTDYKKR